MTRDILFPKSPETKVPTCLPWIKSNLQDSAARNIGSNLNTQTYMTLRRKLDWSREETAVYFGIRDEVLDTMSAEFSRRKNE